MTQPRLRVDFNELVEPDLVLLAKTDVLRDFFGQVVELREGLRIEAYEEDIGGNGQAVELFARGVVERNLSDAAWARACKWVCRIDATGIQHRSE